MDKLTALRVFCRVADLGGFNAAARDLGLSPAAVSKNIRELEASLSVRLINRTTRHLHLTEAGLRYLERTRSALAALAEADADATGAEGTLRGRIRLTAPMTVGIARIAEAVASFLTLHPELSIDLDLDDRAVDLVRGGFDIAIRGAARLADSSLVARRIGGLDRILCAAPSYLEARQMPADPAALVAHDCLIYTLSDTPDRWVFHRGGATEAVTVRGRLQCNNSLAISAAAQAGLGIARVPSVAALPGLSGGKLVRLLTDWTVEPGSLFAIYPQHRVASRPVRAFIDHLAGVLE